MPAAQPPPMLDWGDAISLAISFVSLILSAWVLYAARADRRGANVAVEVYDIEDPDDGHRKLVVDLYNRGERGVRIDGLSVWYGTTDRRIVLEEREVDEVIGSDGKLRLIVLRDGLAKQAREKLGNDPVGRGLLRVEVRMQRGWNTRHVVAKLDISQLSERQRDYGLADHIAANLFLGLKAVTGKNPSPPGNVLK